jgi:hypothetical protein
MEVALAVAAAAAGPGRAVVVAGSLLAAWVAHEALSDREAALFSTPHASVLLRLR